MNPPSHNVDDIVQYNTTVVSSTTTAAAAASSIINNVQFPEIHPAPSAAQHLRQALEIPQINPSSLSAEQSQYFNSLTSQNTGPQAVLNVNSYQPATVQYPTTYAANTASVVGGVGGYGEQIVTNNNINQNNQLPAAARKPRARVPPPSKIPSSAVEMPADTLNNIPYLDVQFGGLDYGTDETFDNLSEKFAATSLDTSAQSVPSSADVSSEYQQKQSSVQQHQQQQQQPSLVGLQSSQQLTESLSSNYTQRNPNSVQQQSSVVSNTVSGNRKLNLFFKFRSFFLIFFLFF